MNTAELLQSRIRPLNTAKLPGKCVLYVMSRDQRILDNHALLAAQKYAISKGLPLTVVFCLYPRSGQRAREHFEFILSGLEQLENDLAKLNIPFMLLVGKPLDRLSAVFYHVQPDAVYFDFSPLKGPMALKRQLAKKAAFACYEVDTHNVVPAWVASSKQETGAYTIRPKIYAHLSAYVNEPKQAITHPMSWRGPIIPLKKLQPAVTEALSQLPSNKVPLTWMSGERVAHEALKLFIDQKLESYAADRNDPSKSGQTSLSPYLHFGQISSLRVVLEVLKKLALMGLEPSVFTSKLLPKVEDKAPLLASVDALIEEIVVRKELSDNFCLYNTDYDNISGAPEWARASLAKHLNDPREFLYTKKQFEDASTHDPAWNAAQRQLITTGNIHGYMRMYWAKKILEWSKTPTDAIKIAINLNDFYSIDGGDPNGYVGILWSIAGLHDRPWTARSIYGQVRYMNYAGLKHKFDIASYETQYT